MRQARDGWLQLAGELWAGDHEVVFEVGGQGVKRDPAGSGGQECVAAAGGEQECSFAVGEAERVGDGVDGLGCLTQQHLGGGRTGGGRTGGALMTTGAGVASATDGSPESRRRKIGVFTGSSTFEPLVMNALQSPFAAPKYPNPIAVPTDACAAPAPSKPKPFRP